jgi:hypothetical protein
MAVGAFKQALQLVTVAQKGRDRLPASQIISLRYIEPSTLYIRFSVLLNRIRNREAKPVRNLVSLQSAIPIPINSALSSSIRNYGRTTLAATFHECQTVCPRRARRQKARRRRRFSISTTFQGYQGARQQQQQQQR